jgi:hypothetical protein
LQLLKLERFADKVIRSSSEELLDILGNNIATDCQDQPTVAESTNLFTGLDPAHVRHEGVEEDDVDCLSLVQESFDSIHRLDSITSLRRRGRDRERERDTESESGCGRNGRDRHDQ